MHPPDIPALTILWHPDPRRTGEIAMLSGARTALSRLEPRFAQPGEGWKRALRDDGISRHPPIHLELSRDGTVLVDASESRIPLEIQGRPVTDRMHLSAEDIARGVPLLLGNRVALLLHHHRPRSQRPLLYGLVGESDAVVEVRQQIQRLATTDQTVLIRGESGTGKELVASALHRASPRRANAFVPINVGSISAERAEIDLFGALVGSFTGADREFLGFFREAHRGTLFLDEIGAAEAKVQDTLLRVLETGEVRPLGASKTQKVHVRILAATDADLAHGVDLGTFRVPLLHRLTAHEIHIPPLRQRREDLGRLIWHFLQRELSEDRQRKLYGNIDRNDAGWLPAALVARWARFHWPGNVRQLRNFVNTLVGYSFAQSLATLPPHLEKMFEALDGTETSPEATVESKTRSPDSISCKELRRALRAHQREVRPTARALRSKPAGLYPRMRQCGIPIAGDLTREQIVSAGEAVGWDPEAMAQHLGVSARGLRIRMKQLGLNPGKLDDDD